MFPLTKCNCLQPCESGGPTAELLTRPVSNTDTHLWVHTPFSSHLRLSWKQGNRTKSNTRFSKQDKIRCVLNSLLTPEVGDLLRFKHPPLLKARHQSVLFKYHHPLHPPRLTATRMDLHKAEGPTPHCFPVSTRNHSSGVLPKTLLDIKKFFRCHVLNCLSICTNKMHF